MATVIELSSWERLQLLRNGLLAAYGRRRHRYKRNAQFFDKLKHAGRLSPEQIAELTQAQVAKVDKDHGRRSSLIITDALINGPTSRLSMQQKGTALLVEVLNQTGGGGNYRTIVNIGARVDVAFSYLARKFPDRKFISVDLQPNLAEHNSALPQSPNWSFVTGYALDLLERSEIRPDVIFMTSTSVLFNSIELDAYFNAMRDIGVRAVVLNEPWAPMPRIIRPENLDPDNPICGGVHGWYHHNYPAKLARAGFAVLRSRIIMGDHSEGIGVLQIVAGR